MWFFPEIANGWSPARSEGSSSWYAVDLGESRTVGCVDLYFFSDGEKNKAPTNLNLQYESSSGWQDVPEQRRSPAQPLANGQTRVTFTPLTTRKIRVVLSNPVPPSVLRMVEFEVFASSSSQ
jgi:hypothetical protein